jgi:hypothetical protein
MPERFFEPDYTILVQIPQIGLPLDMQWRVNLLNDRISRLKLHFQQTKYLVADPKKGILTDLLHLKPKKLQGSQICLGKIHGLWHMSQRLQGKIALKQVNPAES